MHTIQSLYSQLWLHHAQTKHGRFSGLRLTKSKKDSHTTVEAGVLFMGTSGHAKLQLHATGILVVVIMTWGIRQAR